MLRFIVADSGAIVKVELAESSGYSTLDRSALITARKIKRIPVASARPGGAPNTPIDIPVHYKLRG